MADRTGSSYDDWLTDLAGGHLTGPELRATLEPRFASIEEVERAVAEVEVARRVRILMLRLQAAEVEVPVDFELRLLERVRGDQTFLDLLELSLTVFASALIELINALVSFLPATPRAEPYRAI